MCMRVAALTFHLSANHSAGLSDGNNALQYNFYNQGNPILISDVGSKHTRDPFVVRGAHGKQNFIIATDNSLKAINYNFAYANANSSRKITVYDSDGNGFSKWKPARVTKDLLPSWSGGVSAPEAIWDCEKEQVRWCVFS